MTMKLWLTRYCIRCGKPLDPGKQASAFFESAACKQAWQRARAYTRTSPLLKACEERIGRVESVAYWYRLAIRLKGHAWHYPTRHGPTLRFDGLLRATPGFRIRPYEPPVIPVKAEYFLMLCTEAGERVPIPAGESTPFVVEPCRPLAVEDGERVP